MLNIIGYFNAFLHLIFGNSVSLYTPDIIISWIASVSEQCSNLETFIKTLFEYPQYFLSVFVWVWFAWLTIHLLLTVPFKFFKGLFRR